MASRTVDVLNKRGQLSAHEWDLVKKHVLESEQVVTDLDPPWDMRPMVRHHHEHWDGGGYPRGIAGEAISIGGRILAAADAFDALTSKRAYREPMTPEATIDLLGNLVGRLLDPAIHAALRSVVERRKTLIFIDDVHA